MTQVQFGFTLPIALADQERPAFLKGIRAALDTIAGHFDSVWMSDHLQVGNLTILEGWTTLTYLASLHPEMKYGTLVLCQFFRNPALLAKMAATFQYMSEGHFLLGLGAGWAEEEARAYHLPFAPAGQRVNELEEQLQIIKALWQQEDVTFEGRYYQVHHALCLPRPEPLPTVLVAAHKPRLMRVVARYADWWNTSFDTLEEAREKARALDSACECVGRDPSTLRRTAMITCYCAHTERKLQEMLSKHWGPFTPGFVGSPEQIVEQLLPYVAAGYDYFMINTEGVLHDLTTLELFAHEVLPMLNKALFPPP